jgi:hypothetical protein
LPEVTPKLFRDLQWVSWVTLMVIGVQACMEVPGNIFPQWWFWCIQAGSLRIAAKAGTYKNNLSRLELVMVAAPVPFEDRQEIPFCRA